MPRSAICSADDLEIGSSECSVTWLSEGAPCLRLRGSWRRARYGSDITAKPQQITT